MPQSKPRFISSCTMLGSPGSLVVHLTLLLYLFLAPLQLYPGSTLAGYVISYVIIVKCSKRCLINVLFHFHTLVYRFFVVAILTQQSFLIGKWVSFKSTFCLNTKPVQTLRFHYGIQTGNFVHKCLNLDYEVTVVVEAESQCWTYHYSATPQLVSLL